MFSQEVRGKFSRGLDFADQAIQKIGEVEASLQRAANQAIREYLPEGLREKMSAMTDMIIKSAPHALMYFMTLNAILPAIPAVYFMARGFMILRPACRAACAVENEDGLKVARERAKGEVKENFSRELTEIARPAFAVYCLAQAALAFLCLSFIKAGVWVAVAYIIKKDVPPSVPENAHSD